MKVAGNSAHSGWSGVNLESYLISLFAEFRSDFCDGGADARRAATVIADRIGALMNLVAYEKTPENMAIVAAIKGIQREFLRHAKSP